MCGAPARSASAAPRIVAAVGAGMIVVVGLAGCTERRDAFRVMKDGLVYVVDSMGNEHELTTTVGELRDNADDLQQWVETLQAGPLAASTHRHAPCSRSLALFSLLFPRPLFSPTLFSRPLTRAVRASFSPSPPQSLWLSSTIAITLQQSRARAIGSMADPYDTTANSSSTQTHSR